VRREKSKERELRGREKESIGRSSQPGERKHRGEREIGS